MIMVENIENKEIITETFTGWENIQKQFFNENLFQKISTKMEFKPHMTVAEISCSKDDLAVHLCTEVKRVICISPTLRALKTLNELAYAKNCRNLEIREGEIERLPIGTQSVDAILATIVFHQLENPKIALDDSYRVLRPGGLLGIIFLDLHNKEWGSSALLRKLCPSPSHSWYNIKPLKLIKIMEESGFQNLKLHKNLILQNCEYINELNQKLPAVRPPVVPQQSEEFSIHLLVGGRPHKSFF